jgi:hypothetical protein
MWDVSDMMAPERGRMQRRTLGRRRYQDLKTAFGADGFCATGMSASDLDDNLQPFLFTDPEHPFIAFDFFNRSHGFVGIITEFNGWLTVG